MPELSIITINLNNAKGLERTIGSVTAQAYKDFEYIVIDGGSDDGSIDNIKQNQDKIAKWVSEKDTGIYNAMNKGIKFATGKYCLFLNSGDYLYSDNTLLQVFEMNPAEDIVYGNMVIEYPDGKRENGTMPDNITLEHMIKDTLWHPVSFIKRNLFDKYGLYREDLKIASDYDFFFKNLFVNKVSARHINIPVAGFLLDGISSMAPNSELIKTERRSVQLKYADEATVNAIQKKHEEVEQKVQSMGLLKKMVQWLKRTNKL